MTATAGSLPRKSASNRLLTEQLEDVMARNNSMFPMPTGSKSGRLIGGLIAVAVVVAVIHDPVGVAHAVKAVFKSIGAFLEAVDR